MKASDGECQRMTKETLHECFSERETTEIAILDVEENRRHAAYLGFRRDLRIRITRICSCLITNCRRSKKVYRLRFKSAGNNGGI